MTHDQDLPTMKKVSSKKSNLTASTEGTSSDSYDCLTEFQAFINNKRSLKAPYLLQFTEGKLRVLSVSHRKVKMTVDIQTVHAKQLPKEPLKQEECHLIATDDAETRQSQFWYPLKMIREHKKSRKLYFECNSDRKAILYAILHRQGFTSQNDQYEAVRQVDQGCNNPVIVGKQKLTNSLVAIKTVETEKYKNLQKMNRISEAEAMELCKDNPHVVKLVEKFEHDDQVKLVTKLAEEGDLL